MLQPITDPVASDAVIDLIARRWAELAIRLCGAAARVGNPYALYADIADEQQRLDDAECNALAKAIEQMTGYPTPPVQVRDFIWTNTINDKIFESEAGLVEAVRLRQLVCDRAKIVE